jgi:DNA-binding NtrC family response regulator
LGALYDERLWSTQVSLHTGTHAQRLTHSGRVLLVDDDETFRFMIRLHLTQQGCEVFEASHPLEADELLTSLRPDLILCDWRMPQEDGLSFIKRLNLKDNPQGLQPAVIFMSAHSDTEVALNAIELDYLAKPFQMQELSFRVERALKERRAYARLSAYGGGSTYEGRRGQLEGMLGRSAPMRALFHLIERVAPTQSSVLINGESGTGKELIARAIHSLSERAHGPFVAVNCAAIPTHLIESELFGHVRGAFTGAEQAHKGLFEQAEGGTLFLDEIGELPLTLQSKLLRVLQERTFKPVGGERLRSTDVRVISATLKDLPTEVSEGHFRGDLYYRLSVIPITAPPLAQRPEDIPLLVESFVRQAAARLGVATPHLTSEVLVTLSAYHWPGNVRELENAIEHAVVLSQGGRITRDALPQQLLERTPQSGSDHRHKDQNNSPHQSLPQLLLPLEESKGLNVKEHTQALERLLIQQALAQTSGVKSQASQLLSISPKTLLYKMKEYGISS